MTLKRIGALITSVLLMHLALVSSDLPCASHEEQPTSVSAPATATHAGTHSHHDESSGSDEPCQIPVLPECCRAMASCAVSVGAAGIAARDDVPIRHDRVMTKDIDVPASPTDSPEPPPPKS